MKVTFFSGTTLTSTVAAPQVIAVGLVDAEKAQLLSEINEQATALIDTAATTAAVAVAPAAADAIRDQVKADADRAAAAAVGLVSAFVVVEQIDNNLPARPATAAFVLWQTWSDPTARMIPGDMWARPRNPPALPRVPSPEELAAIAFQSGPDGATSALFKSGIAKQYPVLQAIQYQLNDGAWQTLRAAPFLAGDLVAMPALPVGDHPLRFRFQNFLGTGEASPVRMVRAHGTEFTDDFAVAFSALPNFSARDNWSSQPLIMTTAAGLATPDLSARNTFLTTSVQFGDLKANRGAGLFAEADIQRLSGTTATPLIGFSNSNGTQTQGIYVGMLASDRVALIHRDANGTLTMRAEVALPAGHANRGRARIEISPDGTTARGFLDGVQFGTYANPLYATPTAPSAPSLAFRVPSGAPAGTPGILNYRAGKVTA